MLAGVVDHQSTTGLKQVVDGVLKTREEAERLENCKTELNKERPCGEIVEWRLGFSPKEHIEMSWLAEQREWQQECDRKTQEWRDKHDKELAKQHKDSLAEARRMHWRELLIFGLVVGGMACIATIVAAFIERNSLFSDQRIDPPASAPVAPAPSLL